MRPRTRRGDAGDEAGVERFDGGEASLAKARVGQMPASIVKKARARTG